VSLAKKPSTALSQEADFGVLEDEAKPDEIASFSSKFGSRDSLKLRMRCGRG
jgi:hypothetical protein